MRCLATASPYIHPKVGDLRIPNCPQTDSSVSIL
jgi:hypothetical protein